MLLGALAASRQRAGGGVVIFLIIVLLGVIAGFVHALLGQRLKRLTATQRQLLKVPANVTGTYVGISVIVAYVGMSDQFHARLPEWLYYVFYPGKWIYGSSAFGGFVTSAVTALLAFVLIYPGCLLVTWIVLRLRAKKDAI